MPAKSSFLASSLNRRSRSIARSVFSFSWVFQLPGTRARRKLSPRCPWAPSSMFCSTVSRDSALVSWKVRTTPSRATWCGDSLPRSRPSNDQVPVLGWSNPVSRLNSVVLPAPLGPIRPVMPPRWISRWSTDTAVRPPKVRVTLSTTIAGSGLATPTSQGRSFSAAWANRCGTRPAADSRVGAFPAGETSSGRAAWEPCEPGSAGIEHHLSSVTEDALGTEHQQQHEPDADQDEADLRDVGGGEQRVGDGAVGDQRPQPGVGELQDEQQDHGPDDRAQHPARAAEDQCAVGQEGVGVLVLVGDRGPGADGVDHPAEGTDHTAEHQCLHLVGVHVLAQRPDGVLVLADGLDHPTPRAAHELPDQQAVQGNDHPTDERDPQLAAAPRGAQDVVALLGVPRSQGDEGAVEGRQSPGATG